MAPRLRGRDVDWMVRSRRRRIPLAGLGIAVRGLLLPACSEPNADERTSQGVVATAFDPIVDFGALSTFATVDSVALDTSFGDGGTLPAAQSQQILDRIAANLTARGYRRVDRGASPDLGVNAVLFFQVNVVSTVAPGAWWGGAGYPSPAVWGFHRRVRFGIWICESGVQERDVDHRARRPAGYRCVQSARGDAGGGGERCGGRRDQVGDRVGGVPSRLRRSGRGRARAGGLTRHRSSFSTVSPFANEMMRRIRKRDDARRRRCDAEL